MTTPATTALMTRTPDELWLDLLQRIVSRAAHEVKGALNAVAVNLEVVRSRTEPQPATGAGDVGRYARVAAEHLDTVIAMNEALLALGRPAREPADGAALVRQFHALLAPCAKTAGGAMELAEPLAASALEAPAVPARLGIGAAILSAAEGTTRISADADEARGEWVLRIHCTDGLLATVPDDVVAAAADAGVRVQAERSGKDTSIVVRCRVHRAP